MKYLPNIVGGLLGLMFIAFGMLFFFGPPPPEMAMPEAADHFNKATLTTGFMHYVKAFEVIGGILVAIPRTRNFGLLVLGPIIINIIAYHAFLAGFSGPAVPIIGVISLFALYLLWDGRRQFAGLLKS